MRMTMVLGLALALGACGGQGDETGSTRSALTPGELALGQDVWVKATFGGQFFFSLMLPQPPLSLQMGFDEVLHTPRAKRFAEWGTINQPGCTDNANPDIDHPFDNCNEPGVLPPTHPQYQIFGEPTGVVGVRAFRNPFFAGYPGHAPVPPGLPPSAAKQPWLVGVSCAGCHAGLHPGNPPADPAAPEWSNIHLTAGNQYLQTGKIFGAHITDPSDPRYQVFHSWKAGTVDTTAIESDHINNPGIITQFWNMPARPYFDLTYSNFGVLDPPSASPAIHVHRGGQGGEDDTGCQMAALRVYFNIGMCAAECMLPNLHGGKYQTPIDLAACASKCQFYDPAAQLVNPMCGFMATQVSPHLPAELVDHPAASRGKHVFEQNCASCHSNGEKLKADTILSDDELHPARGPLSNELAGEIGTNSCRSKTTNWQTGQIWAAFSSDEQKARGPGYYRDVPLAAAWATAPFFHNNELGAQPDLADPDVASYAGRIALYEDAMDQLLNPWKRTPKVNVTTALTLVPTPFGVTLPIPPGTPIGAFANLDPATLQNRCPDFVENEGHYFGAALSDKDKHALTEYLKTK